MQSPKTHKIVRISRDHSQILQRQLAIEHPLRLKVNDRELATLICSPHKLNYLVAGFLHLQGFIKSLEDILSLGVCSDSGLAKVCIKGSVPDHLPPTLTSGCGTGISFNLPEKLPASSRTRQFDISSLRALMNELNSLSELYQSHGGIHSAAIGDHDGLLLHAEDIGRHNTLDRLAGEAMFRKLNLNDKMLATSGRVSSEMVAKAARLGIGLIASRTSPTDKAIELCEQAGITLVGYLRGESLEIYCHHEQLQLTGSTTQIRNISGVILAGGESRRMGSDKSLLPIQGARFIDHVYRRMASLFAEVIIVTNSPELYKEIPCRKVPDIYPANGPLAGVHSGLVHADNKRIFVVGCDMPFVSPVVVREICSHADQGDLIIPHTSGGHEPLHALYNKSCLPAMEEILSAGQQRIKLFFDRIKCIELAAEVIQELDPEELSFKNINTPEDYYRLREDKQESNVDSPRQAVNKTTE